MVSVSRFATYRVVHVSGLENPNLGEYFVEGDNDPIPPVVRSFVRLLKKLGEFHAGETLLVRTDELNKWCQVFERHPTHAQDISSKKGDLCVYLFKEWPDGWLEEKDESLGR